MKRFLVLSAILAMAIVSAGCSAGGRVKTDGALGAGVKWDGGPRVDAKVPSLEVEANAGAVPGAVPFAGGTPAAAAPTPPQPDPALLDRLDKIQAALDAAEKDGSKSADEISKLRAELSSLRDEEKTAPGAPPPPAPLIIERAPGFIARLVSGDFLGALMGPEGLIATILLLLGGNKARKSLKAASQRRRDRTTALEKSLGITPK